MRPDLSNHDDWKPGWQHQSWEHGTGNQKLDTLLLWGFTIGAAVIIFGVLVYVMVTLD